MQGTIMSISRIGSVADRYEWAPSVTITNCYYYAESDVQYNLPKYHCGKKSLATILASDEEKEKMLQGDLSYLSEYIGGRNHRPSYSIDLTKLSYEQMAGRKDVTKNGQDKRILELLNQNRDSVFGWVTVEEAQAEVHGKSSFPGKNIAVLDGQDYPFTTVLTQASEHTDSGRANLHYGDWPLVGPVWEKSSVTIDRITDYDAGIGSAVITAVLKLENMEDGKLDGLTLESFRSTNESIARVTGFQKVDAKTCRVTLEGLANGSVEITAALDGHVARLMVSVTAELTIRMSNEIEHAKQITVNEAATVPLGLAALDRGHEVACHTATHPTIARCPISEVADEIFRDRAALEARTGYPVRGLSYPNGSVTEEIERLLPMLGIRYSRVVGSSDGFALPENPYRWMATCHHNHRLLELGEQFRGLFKKQYLYLMYVWGHSYEFGEQGNWALMEEFCARMGGRDDIWYCTNIELMDCVDDFRRLQFAADNGFVYNPSARACWIRVNDGEPVCVAAGETKRL